MALWPRSAARRCASVSAASGSPSRMRVPRPRANTTARNAGEKDVSRTRLHVDDRNGRRAFPRAAREIRELRHGRLLRHRLDAQADDGADGRRVVDVEVGRLAFAETLDQTVVLDEVHAA